MLHPPASPAAPDPDRLLSVSALPGPRPGSVVVEVIGEVDAYTAPLLDVCLDSQARQRGVREVVVDLSRVTSLGAAGVTVLARAHRRCGVRGARLVVHTGGRRRLLRALQLTGAPGSSAHPQSGGEPVPPSDGGNRSPPVTTSPAATATWSPTNSR
ncbi:STAS domain-containing protein [Geodermatophilus poikilotrophus]|uniref:Anti-anti-sigma factor n=1 Tax=Geodermatophilus poikilotrophus TaxID=1333667 RepID=A0A1H9YYI0_9ACTN|nr:STAS domain-containing protein [Geodermatophilus poikilotrophus]SES74163.1 anti-anti-sigma factor [Geodermatophilus poikilotrophus]